MAEMASLLFSGRAGTVTPLATANIRRMPGVSRPQFPVRGRTHLRRAVRGAPDRLPGCVHAFNGRPHLVGEDSRRTRRNRRRARPARRAWATRDVLLRPRLAVDVP